MSSYAPRNRIKQRYFREAIAYPKEAIVHHADCLFYCIKICSCGLLHDLLPYVYLWDMYPKYEEDVWQQEHAIAKYRMERL